MKILFQLPSEPRPLPALLASLEADVLTPDLGWDTAVPSWASLFLKREGTIHEIYGWSIDNNGEPRFDNHTDQVADPEEAAKWAEIEEWGRGKAPSGGDLKVHAVWRTAWSKFRYWILTDGLEILCLYIGGDAGFQNQNLLPYSFRDDEIHVLRVEGTFGTFEGPDALEAYRQKKYGHLPILPEIRPAGPPGVEFLVAPRGHRDDLTKISGLTPLIEKRLNDLGVFHFWQIAHLNEWDIYKIEIRLKARGLITREKWIFQAHKLGGAED